MPTIANANIATLVKLTWVNISTLFRMQMTNDLNYILCDPVYLKKLYFITVE